MHCAKSNILASSSSWGRQLIDISLCSIGLAVLSPVFVLIACGILWETGFPILFSQNRVGRGGQKFRLLKFRTMQTGKSGLFVTVSGDPRVTSFGRFLRRFKLDEIPQLWNVVRAEMALVGPRPEVPEFVDLSHPAWQSVLRVRPGVTDPVSITFRNEEKLLAMASNPILYYRETILPAKLAMSLVYLQQRSWWSDLNVILRTLNCVINPDKV